MVGTSRQNSNGKRSNKEEERREITWRNTLFKKARELSVLTGCEIALIINTANGIRHECVENTSMQEIMQKLQRHFVGENHIARNEDNGVLLLEYNNAEVPMDMSLSNENVQAMKLSERDMHKILDSYTDKEIDMFEQKLNQNLINLLEMKVQSVQKEIDFKWKLECFSVAECMQILKEIENKQEEMNQLLIKLHEVKEAQRQLQEVKAPQRQLQKVKAPQRKLLPGVKEVKGFYVLDTSDCYLSTSESQGVRDDTCEGIGFDMLGRSDDVASTSLPGGVRDNRTKEIQFDILKRSALEGESSSEAQERAEVEFHDERNGNAQDRMKIDLELCL